MINADNTNESISYYKSYINASGTTLSDKIVDYRNELPKYYPSEWEFFSYFTEKEVEDMIEKLLQREKSEYIIKGFFSGIIKSKHFSEDFIGKYIDYIDKDDLYVRHDSDLKSGQYSRLKSLFMVEEN